VQERNANEPPRLSVTLKSHDKIVRSARRCSATTFQLIRNQGSAIRVAGNTRVVFVPNYEQLGGAVLFAQLYVAITRLQFDKAQPDSRVHFIVCAPGGNVESWKARSNPQIAATIETFIAACRSKAGGPGAYDTYTAHARGDELSINAVQGTGHSTPMHVNVRVNNAIIPAEGVVELPERIGRQQWLTERERHLILDAEMLERARGMVELLVGPPGAAQPTLHALRSKLLAYRQMQLNEPRAGEDFSMRRELHTLNPLAVRSDRTARKLTLVDAGGKMNQTSSQLYGLYTSLSRYGHVGPAQLLRDPATQRDAMGALAELSTAFRANLQTLLRDLPPVSVAEAEKDFQTLKAAFAYFAKKQCGDIYDNLGILAMERVEEYLSAHADRILEDFSVEDLYSLVRVPLVDSVAKIQQKLKPNTALDPGLEENLQSWSKTAGWDRFVAETFPRFCADVKAGQPVSSVHPTINVVGGPGFYRLLFLLGRALDPKFVFAGLGTHSYEEIAARTTGLYRVCADITSMDASHCREMTELVFELLQAFVERADDDGLRSDLMHYRAMLARVGGEWRPRSMDGLARLRTREQLQSGRFDTFGLNSIMCIVYIMAAIPPHRFRHLRLCAVGGDDSLVALDAQVELRTDHFARFGIDIKLEYLSWTCADLHSLIFYDTADGQTGVYPALFKTMAKFLVAHHELPTRKGLSARDIAREQITAIKDVVDKYLPTTERRAQAIAANVVRFPLHKNSAFGTDDVDATIADYTFVCDFLRTVAQSSGKVLAGFYHVAEFTVPGFDNHGLQ
jgi:hypothetical protein